MDNTHFEKLKKLVEAERLEIYIIIAPPRANSSVIEHALGNSPDVEHECHEPFLMARHKGFDPDHGYKQIYECIGGQNFEDSEERTSIIVKEMSHWIGKNEEYKRLALLTTKPILALIRNPLLTVESRIRRVLTGIDMRYSLDLQRYLLDEFATQNGFLNWPNVIDAIFQGTSNLSLDFLKIKAGKERLYDTPILTLQNLLLDRKARANGYANWRDLLESKLEIEEDYSFFDEILSSNKRRLAFEKDEFTKLLEEIAYFEQQNIEFLIIDTTDLRAFPTEYLQILCEQFQIKFDKEMIRWGDMPVDFHTEQSQEFEKLWYDTLFSSSRVNPPIEIPPTIEKFPKHMQGYLANNNLPAYWLLSKEKTIPTKIQNILNNHLLLIADSAANRLQFQNGDIKYYKEAPNRKLSVKLKYLDPVYAITNEPNLLNDLDFSPYIQKYFKEIEALTS